jgi:hypothetical protein
MIAGHFGFAALVKAREQRVRLWALMLATGWLDIAFVPLLLMKIETLEPVAGTRGGYGRNVIHADYTHSLLGALVLSLVFGVICAIPWGKTCGAVLGVVSFSHWLLDLVVHRHDMPFLPGNLGSLPKLGFGLWRFQTASAVIELILVAGGAWSYGHAARAVTMSARKGQRRAVITALLVLIFGIGILVLDVTGVMGRASIANLRVTQAHHKG